MTCADCLDTLGPFIDGELPPDEAALVKEHLGGCADCAAAHRRLVETSSRVKGALMRYQAPDVLKARIRASLAETAREAPSQRAVVAMARGRVWPRMLAAAAVVAMVSSAATLAVVHQRTPSNSIEQQVLRSEERRVGKEWRSGWEAKE